MFKLVKLQTVISWIKLNYTLEPPIQFETFRALSHCLYGSIGPKLNLCWLLPLNFGFTSHASSHWYLEGIYSHLSPLTCVELLSILNESFPRQLHRCKVFISHIFHVNNFSCIFESFIVSVFVCVSVSNH